jgi:hypothetical protein
VELTRQWQVRLGVTTVSGSESAGASDSAPSSGVAGRARSHVSESRSNTVVLGSNLCPSQSRPSPPGGAAVRAAAAVAAVRLSHVIRKLEMKPPLPARLRRLDHDKAPGLRDSEVAAGSPGPGGPTTGPPRRHDSASLSASDAGVRVIMMIVVAAAAVTVKVNESRPIWTSKNRPIAPAGGPRGEHLTTGQ